MSTFGYVNSAVLAVYLISMVMIGLRFAWRQESAEDYFLAGRNMPWLPVAMSMFASLTSAITFMGLPARAYEENLDRCRTIPDSCYGRVLGCHRFGPAGTRRCGKHSERCPTGRPSACRWMAVLALFILGFVSAHARFWAWAVSVVVAVTGTLVLKCHVGVHWVYYVPFAFSLSFIVTWVLSTVAEIRAMNIRKA